MDTQYTTAGREWKVDERVIVVSTHPSSVAPRVLKIQRVAEKSFVVDGERYRRDKLEKGLPTAWTGSGWGRFSVTIIPLDHPYAPALLAERALYKQWRQVYSAQSEWDRNHTVESAETLRSELADWIEARKVRDSEQASWAKRTRDGR